jgi:hypothetical protein
MFSICLGGRILLIGLSKVKASANTMTGKNEVVNLGQFHWIGFSFASGDCGAKTEDNSTDFQTGPDNMAR